MRKFHSFEQNGKTSFFGQDYLSPKQSISQAPELKAIEAARHQLKLKIPKDNLLRKVINLVAEHKTSSDYAAFFNEEKSYAAIFLPVTHLIERNIGLLKMRLKKEIQQYYFKLKNTDEAKTNPNYIFEETFQRDRAHEYLKNKTKYDGNLIGIADRKAVLEKSIEDLNRNIAFTTTKSGVPVKRVYDTSIGYYATLFLLSLLEIPLNFLALQTLGIFSNLNAMAVSAGLGLVSILLAHTCGSNLEKRRWLPFTFSAIASSLLFAIIIYLRLEELVIALLPVVLWLGGFVFAYERAINAVYFSLMKSLKATQSQLRKLKKQEKSIENKILEANSKVDRHYQRKAEGLSHDSQQQSIQEKINDLKSELAELDAIEQAEKELVTDFFTERMLFYRNTVNTQLSNYGLSTITWKSPPSLTEAPEELTAKPAAATSTPSKPSPNPFPKLNGMKSLVNMVALLCCCLFGFSSCSEEATQTEGMISIDLTDESLLGHIQSADFIANFIADNFFGFDDTASPNFGQITIGSIEETALSKTQTVVLEQGEHYLLRTENARKNDIQQFKKNIKTAIDSTLQQRKAHQNSQLHRHLCECTRRFKKSATDNRFILMFSDLIEYTSTKANFYHYKKHPERLLEDYDELVKTMDADCSVDLAGVEITIVQLPNAHSELGNVARKFWEKYFRSKNTEVTFLANL